MAQRYKFSIESKSFPLDISGEPYKAATEYIYSGSTNKKTKVDHFSGITISDPSTRQEIAESKRQTNWWIQTH